MTDSSLKIYFSNDSEDTTDLLDDNTIWANLEQAELEDEDNTVSAEDLVKMYYMVLRGESAFAYNSGNCPVTITSTHVVLHLDIYVWPSDLDLAYTLTSNGDVGPGVRTQLWKTFNQVIPATNTLTYDFLLDNAAMRWLSDSYSPQGERISHPDFEIYKNKIVFEEDNFSIMRFNGNAIGYKHQVDIALEYDVPEDQNFNMGYIRGDFSGKVQIKYIDETSEEVVKSLSLEVPSCLESMLNTCLGAGGVRENTQASNDQESGRYYEVVYNPCNGDVESEGWKSG